MENFILMRAALFGVGTYDNSIDCLSFEKHDVIYKHKNR